MKTEVPDLEQYPIDRAQTVYPDIKNWYLHVDWTDNDDNPREPTYPVPDGQILICYSRRIEFWDRYMRDLTDDVFR